MSYSVQWQLGDEINERATPLSNAAPVWVRHDAAASSPFSSPLRIQRCCAEATRNSGGRPRVPEGPPASFWNASSCKLERDADLGGDESASLSMRLRRTLKSQGLPGRGRRQKTRRSCDRLEQGGAENEMRQAIDFITPACWACLRAKASPKGGWPTAAPSLD